MVYERKHAKQNTFLLNKKNELNTQINKILENLFTIVPVGDRKKLIKIWTIYFLSPRIAYSVRQLKSGEFKLALSHFQNLPLGITYFDIIFGYFSWKLKLPSAKQLIDELFMRIIELNKIN